MNCEKCGGGLKEKTIRVVCKKCGKFDIYELTRWDPDNYFCSHDNSHKEFNEFGRDYICKECGHLQFIVAKGP